MESFMNNYQYQIEIQVFVIFALTNLVTWELRW